MDAEELQYFKKKLISMKQEIEMENTVVVHDMQVEDSLYPDPNDRASLESDRITTLRIRDRERKLLSKIDESLEAIEKGSYGECEECGGPIGFKRLDIRPVTTLCINCKEEREEMERIGKEE